jgi:transcriptional regulator with XRE-family HTH domain
MALHEVVRRARLEQERTIADVAEVAGVEESHLSRFERGARGMSSDKLDRLLHALGIQIGDHDPFPLDEPSLSDAPTVA